MLQHILKRLLNVVLFRYVDDFFGIERSSRMFAFVVCNPAVCLHEGRPQRNTHLAAQSGLFVVCWDRVLLKMAKLHTA